MSLLRMGFLSRLSIRWRITLGSLLIAALFFGAAGVVFRFQVDSILHRTASTLLSNDAEQFETLAGFQQWNPVDQPGRGQLVAVFDPSGKHRGQHAAASLSARLTRW